jgi:crotonobetainyl-CoA:carnitine CoA-transferase CaiB-like acyl-CoA transferase
MLTLLSDLRVIVVCNTIAPAYAGRLLADLGAEVIALEPPRGNRLRQDPQLAPNLAEFLATNTLSAILDLPEAADGRLAASICERADIVLFDRSVPYFERHLLQERVFEQTDVVLTVVTPWGLKSPYDFLCEDELLAFALSGIASITPEESEDEEYERPMQLYGHQAQFAAGLTAAVASLQGWFASRQSGQALLNDVSVLDALTSMPLISQAAVFAGHPLPRAASERPQTVPRGFLHCRDGYVYTQGGDDNWNGWAQLLGRPEWEATPFSEPEYRERHWQELGAAIQQWLDSHSNAEVYRACQAKGITCFPVNSIGQVIANSQIVERDIVEEILRPGGAPSFRAMRTPFRQLVPEAESRQAFTPGLGADLKRVEAILELQRVPALGTE